MDEAEEVHKYLELSREYAATARQALAAGNLAPSRFLAIHALELAVKAALAASGSVERTHNVGGEFGKRFRAKVGPETARRINRILGEYDAPRYPSWEPPPRKTIVEDLDFIESFVRSELPTLLDEVAG